MKHLKLLPILLLLLSLNKISAQTTIKTIKKRGYIKVGTTENQIPFTFRDDNNKLLGIDIDLASKLAKEMNVKVKFVKIELANLIDSLINGNIDIIFSGFSITTSRNMDVLFTQPYYETGKGIISKMKKLNSGKIKNINNEDVKLVAVKNSSSVDYIKNKYPKAKLIIKENGDKCVDALKNGEADAMITDYENCETIFYYSDLKGDYDYTLLDNEKGVEHEYIGAAVSYKDIIFYNLINNFLMKIDRNNDMSIIKKSWEKYTE